MDVSGLRVQGNGILFCLRDFFGPLSEFFSSPVIRLIIRSPYAVLPNLREMMRLPFFNYFNYFNYFDFYNYFNYFPNPCSVLPTDFHYDCACFAPPPEECAVKVCKSFGTCWSNDNQRCNGDANATCSAPKVDDDCPRDDDPICSNVAVGARVCQCEPGFEYEPGTNSQHTTTLRNDAVWEYRCTGIFFFCGVI